MLYFSIVQLLYSKNCLWHWLRSCSCNSKINRCDNDLHWYKVIGFFLEFSCKRVAPHRHSALYFYKKMGQPRPLFHLFLSYQTHITIFTVNKCEKCPSSIRCWDSNSRPLEHESPPITTTPGLPPNWYFICNWIVKERKLAKRVSNSCRKM